MKNRILLDRPGYALFVLRNIPLVLWEICCIMAFRIISGKSMKPSLNEIRIRSLTISPPLILAPMAGLTHTALRRMLLELGGVGMLSTEMLSAVRLPSENPVISPFLARSPEERPLSYQVILCRVKDVAPAFDTLHSLGADAIDLNLGCPAPNIRRIGAGSKLMEQPDSVRRLVSEARKRTKLPLTAKIRLGVELNEQKLRDFCWMLEGEGLDLLSVHARLRDEPFGRKPRWEWIAKVKSWLGVPVFANGGIFSVEDARKCLDVSGADGLMIGRGAATHPWLFREIAREVYGMDAFPHPLSRMELYQRFIELLEESFAPERRLGRLKEFTHYFSKNYQFGHHLASAVQSSASVKEARQRALLFFGEQGDVCESMPSPSNH